ncbi:hypothetical protein C5S53_02245 [Methanophagales archaeon]|nr:hypothetical protein C5S53_02245 [Methanophagales archaeon]
MEEYEEKVLKYCREQVLPKGYKINEVWRRKLITLVEDAAVNYNEFARGFDTDSEVQTCIETGDIDKPICEACINADYLTDDEKIFLLNTYIRKKIERDRCMTEKIGFVLGQSIPYQLCLSYLLEHEPLTEDYLFFLLMSDPESPADCFIHNFRIVLNDGNLSDTVKIGYYLCLPASRRDNPNRLKKATSLLLYSDAIAKGNRVKVFELLREPDLFKQLRKGLEELREAEATDAGEVYLPPFIDDLFQSLAEMPEELQEGFLRNLFNVIDFDFNCVRRQVCDWYISQLPTLESKKDAIVLLLEGVTNVKSDGGKYMKLSAYDASYSLSWELGTNFVRQLLVRGTHSNLADIRAHCFKYLLLLFDTLDYVEACLNDTSKKVRETVVRSAFSGTEMGRSTRLRLSELIKEKNLKLTKKQKGRLKNLLEP